MKFYRIKRIVVLKDDRIVFLMKNGDSIFKSCFGDGFHNQHGEPRNPLYDEFTEEIVGFTDVITLEIDDSECDEAVRDLDLNFD